MEISITSPVTKPRSTDDFHLIEDEGDEESANSVKINKKPTFLAPLKKTTSKLGPLVSSTPKVDSVIQIANSEQMVKTL